MNTKLIIPIAVVAIIIIAAMLALSSTRGQLQKASSAPSTASPSTSSTPSTTASVTTSSTVSSSTASVTRLTGALTGGGSTFINPQMQYWIQTFYNITAGRIVVNYQAIGSGAGISGLLAGNLAFAAADVPLPENVYKQVRGQVVQFPAIVGSVVIIYNVPEIAYSKTKAALRLNGTILAEIYLGKIRQWCDPKIKALNPNLSNLLPCKDIIAVHRSDGSGTTAAFTLWLSKTLPEWNSTVGWGLSLQWPRDQIGLGMGAKGSEGVSQAVLNTPYSIGYVEYNYWWTNRDKYSAVGGAAEIYNSHDGKFYAPSEQAVQLGVSAGLQRVAKKLGGFPKPDADWNPISVELSDPPAGYPIVSFTYIILWKDYSQRGQEQVVPLLKEFFTWVLTEGQKPNNILTGYIPLPEDLKNVGLSAINEIK